MVIMDHLEWSMLSYYGILFENSRKIMQQTEKEALSPKVYYLHVMTGDKQTKSLWQL